MARACDSGAIEQINIINTDVPSSLPTYYGDGHVFYTCIVLVVYGPCQMSTKPKTNRHMFCVSVTAKLVVRCRPEPKLHKIRYGT